MKVLSALWDRITIRLERLHLGKPSLAFLLSPTQVRALSDLRDGMRLRLGRPHLRWAIFVLLLLPPILIGAEALFRARLQPPTTQLGATRIYSRPLLLEPGKEPDRRLVEDHLQRLGYRIARGSEVGIGEYYLGSRGWIIGRRPFRPFPDLAPDGFVIVRLDSRGRISRLEDEEGNRLGRVALEPELIGRVAGLSEEDRIPVRLEEIPGDLVAAVLRVEDQRFFEHGGLDLRRIGAAAIANMKAGMVVQGGSTLTQQLAKNLFLTPRRSVIRKLREAAMAVTLELRHSKEEILLAYLNQVNLGQDGAAGIHGVGRAAEYFFGKDVSTLELAESALLTALIRAPSLYSPFRNPETARARRDLVLSLMQDSGVISEEDCRDASNAPLGVRSRNAPIRSARYFTDYVLGSSPDVGRVGAIVTTLDPRLQRAAEEAVRSGLARLERDFRWLRPEENQEPLQAALVALEPRTGEILAMVGGRDYGTSQFNRATHARRQPGSAFKPVVALAALARGDPSDSDPGTLLALGRPEFTLASELRDEPFQLETPAGLWQPANYDRSYEGPVTLRDALERSLNVPFARLGMAVGPDRVVETARKLGIESPLDPFPSIALGASEVSPLELTRAFGVLAAGGFMADTRATLAVATRVEPTAAGDGGPGGDWAFDPAEAYLVTSALMGAVERGTGRGLREKGFHGDIAAKSGTTNDFRDGWFVGYTPSLVVGVWVGFDHGKRLELPGAGVALPIFSEFLMEAIGRGGDEGPWGSEGFSYPTGLEVVDVDPLSGLRGGWGCRGEPELFLEGTAPEESCAGFHWSDRTLIRLLQEAGDNAPRLLRQLLERLGFEEENRRGRRGGR